MIKYILYFFALTILFNPIAGCDSINSVSDEPDSIFGYWKLDRIVYGSGKVLRPGDGGIYSPNPENELYWLGFRDIDVNAEGEYHKKLTGGAYCNWADGWFTEKPGRELDVTLICSRLLCGIATEFCSAVTTSCSCSFHKGRLVLRFNSKSRGDGIVVLDPFDPTNWEAL